MLTTVAKHEVLFAGVTAGGDAEPAVAVEAGAAIDAAREPNAGLAAGEMRSIGPSGTALDEFPRAAVPMPQRAERVAVIALGRADPQTSGGLRVDVAVLHGLLVL